jgi:hypothetical protein
LRSCASVDLSVLIAGQYRHREKSTRSNPPETSY